MSIPRWVDVSYVCRYWRNVALGCARLWACLFFVSPEWIDEQLRRSKTAPLIVCIYDSWTLRRDARFIRSLKKVLENIYRIQELWIGFPSGDMVDVINARLNAAAPLLQLLYLLAKNCPGRCHFIMPEDTFPGVTSLQKVHLEMCDVDWSSRIFNGLTELTLCCTSNHSRKNWDGVLLILRRSPHLRQLRLSEVFPSASVSAPSVVSENVANPISLPRLEGLTLVDPIAWVMLLLVHLEFPKSTIVRLDCIFDDIHDISTLLSHIPDRFSHPSSPPLPQSVESAQTEFRCLDLLHHGGTWKLAYGTRSHTDRSLFLFTEAGLCSQIVSTHVDHGLNPDYFFQWFRVFPLAHVSVFTLHGYTTSGIDDELLWTEVFRETSELCIIGMQHYCLENLIHALESRDGIIPVPTLTYIWFSEVEFQPGECSAEENGYGQGYLECLRSALTSRARAGIMVQRLGLRYCGGITKHDVTELSKVVGRVECT